MLVDGREVAEIVPIPWRPPFLAAQKVLANPADPGLRDDLRELLGDETTDDIEDPWERAARRSSSGGR